mmetsp:Transcript_25235/g.35241  ORF Transcript_25235/g.35241 Transcript_25235/m.35241 type:complete len:102 (+) Transcript_25235:370-675(+)
MMVATEEGTEAQRDNVTASPVPTTTTSAAAAAAVADTEEQVKKEEKTEKKLDDQNSVEAAAAAAAVPLSEKERTTNADDPMETDQIQKKMEGTEEGMDVDK